MKKLSYFVITICSFILFSAYVSATKIVEIDNYDVRFRSAPTTNSTIINSFNKGKELELISDSAGTGNGCNKAWYKVSDNGTIGYVCSEFVIVKEVQEQVIDPSQYTKYSEYLKSLGFPDSYIPNLIKLHNAHPNWQFKVFKANVDFNKIVTIEYDGDKPKRIDTVLISVSHSCNLSLGEIQSTIKTDVI